jgi:hypothetical protein
MMYSFLPANVIDVMLGKKEGYVTYAKSLPILFVIGGRLELALAALEINPNPCGWGRI